MASNRRPALVGILAALTLGSGPAWAAPPSDELEGRFPLWFRYASALAPGRWGIAIADAEGNLVWSVSPHTALVPASALKILTTGYARSVLGPAARQRTRIVGTGLVDPWTGTWLGPWSLEVNGDPSLEHPAGRGPSLRNLAAQLASEGVRRLAGPLIVTTSSGLPTASYPQVWAQRHRGRLFAPPVGSIVVHENFIAFRVAPGPEPGAPAAVLDPAPAGIETLIEVRARTVAGDRTRLALHARGERGWLLTGEIGTEAPPRPFAVVAPDPAAVLTAAWARALRDEGIAWEAEQAATSLPAWLPEPKGPLARHLARIGFAFGVTRSLAEALSPPLDSLAMEINRRSLNLGAEQLLRWAGSPGPEAPGGAFEAHVREVTGADSSLHLVDGSGLSEENRVSAMDFVTYLARFPRTPPGRDLPGLLPANGRGTLSRLGTALPEVGVVRAKTGTLRDVSTVVGYLGRPDGVLVFAVMYNGPRFRAAREAQWELLRILGADGVAVPTGAIDGSSEDPSALGAEPLPEPARARTCQSILTLTRRGCLL